MQISKNTNIIKEDKEQDGFTIVELVVVLAGLSALLAFSVPAVLNLLKINRIEEAKALMNSYAAECLGKLRIEPDTKKFRDEAKPDTLDNEKLLTLGYKIDGLGSDEEKSKCSHTRIIPADEKEQFLFAFDFKVSPAGVLKTATPSNNPDALNSCKGWAGELCGLSAEQEALFAELERLQIAEDNCESKYDKLAASGFTGETSRWDKDKKDCVRPVCLYKGKGVSCDGGIEQAREDELGADCTNWVSSKTSNLTYISPVAGESREACGDQKFWFHTGKEYSDKDEWYIKSCNFNYQNDKKTQEGEYTYKPTGGPEPCGNKIYLCSGKKVEYQEYKDTCGAAPPPPPPPPPTPPPPPPSCGKKPKPCLNPWTRWTNPICTCWNQRGI